MSGFRALGFNVWRDPIKALGAITDPFDSLGDTLGAVVILGRQRGFGVAYMRGTRDPGLFVFIGGSFIGIDRYPEGYE